MEDTGTAGQNEGGPTRESSGGRRQDRKQHKETTVTVLEAKTQHTRGVPP